MYEPLAHDNEVLAVGLESTHPAYLGYPAGTSAQLIQDDIRANVAFELLKRLAMKRFMGRGSEVSTHMQASPPDDHDQVARWVRKLHVLSKAEYVGRLTNEEHYDEGVFYLPSGRLDVFAADDVAPTLPSHVLSITPSKAVAPLADAEAPLSNPVKTSLDLTAFPHLGDLIVASCSSAQMLTTLASANRTLSASVQRLFEHVLLLVSPDQTTFALCNRSGPLPGFNEILPIRPAPNVAELENYQDGPLEHYGPWESPSVVFPPMSSADFTARMSLLGHTRVLDFPDPLLDHVGPMVLGLRRIDVGRMVST